MRQNVAKTLFFTSDWHINHERCLDLDQRPFKDLDHMHHSLITNYNATVPKDGVCYFLGDIGMGSSEVIKEVIDQLNGTKICVLGNHDKGMTAMYGIGFDVVLYGAVIYLAGQRVTMSHCPLLGVFREDTTGYRNGAPGELWHGESRHKRYSFHNDHQFHLHGHIHAGKSCLDKIVRTEKQWDIGVPGNSYRPVSSSAVESWISKSILDEQNSWKLPNETKTTDGA